LEKNKTAHNLLYCIDMGMNYRIL